jgi:hypothetical protein
MKILHVARWIIGIYVAISSIIHPSPKTTISECIQYFAWGILLSYLFVFTYIFQDLCFELFKNLVLGISYVEKYVKIHHYIKQLKNKITLEFNTLFTNFEYNTQDKYEIAKCLSEMSILTIYMCILTFVARILNLEMHTWIYCLLSWSSIFIMIGKVQFTLNKRR